tara:strand:+ start:1285 stop:1521 length:237 start_codon:yes stop_codon:yes gene_type:complete
MAKYRITHYKEDCISCGACAAISPEFWEMDEEGMAQLKGSKKMEGHWERVIDSEDSRAQIQESVDVCPVQIIKLDSIE